MTTLKINDMTEAKNYGKMLKMIGIFIANRSMLAKINFFK